MNFQKFLIIHLVFIILILDILVGNVKEITKEYRKHYSNNTENTESQHVLRLEKIKDVLPEEGFIGYFTNKKYSPGDDARFYFLTQYALSPLIIIRDKKQQILIADVDESFDVIEFCKKHNYSIVKDSGRGIIVLRKKQE